MQFPPPPRIPSGPRRRTLLASAAGGLLLTGCTDGPEEREEATAGSPSLAERARARAAVDSAGLVSRYDAVLTAHPALADRIGPLRETAVRHVTAFGGVRRSPQASATASAASSTTGPAAPTPPASAPPPGTERDALAELAASERALADRRSRELLAMPGELARLLASVAAAGAAHAYLLTRTPTEGPA
ncbi:hypothetical protein [Streptomyces sp. NPDC005017]|uniref:hypothetical protein n=1 Tax=Streptomyces sp. NPDC005017 TaxID=3364706 RepID=UPI003689B151